MGNLIGFFKQIIIRPTLFECLNANRIAVTVLNVIIQQTFHTVKRFRSVELQANPEKYNPVAIPDLVSCRGRNYLRNVSFF